MRQFIHLLVFTLLVAPLIVGQGRNAADEGWSELLPPDKEKELVAASCTAGCHNLKGVVHQRNSRADWERSVNDMIQRGAQIFPEEIEPITAYLAKYFGPDVPNLVNVNTASRQELDKLPNFTPEIVTRILDARGKSGAFKNAEELRRAVGLEKDAFEKIRYVLKYRN